MSSSKNESVRKKAKIIKEEVSTPAEVPSSETVVESVKKNKRTIRKTERKKPNEMKSKEGVLYIGHIPNGFFELEIRGKIMKKKQ